MPRESFDRELQRLQDEVLALGSMVENAITEAVDTLKRRDVEGARRIIAQDRLINVRCVFFDILDKIQEFLRYGVADGVRKIDCRGAR